MAARFPMNVATAAHTKIARINLFAAFQLRCNETSWSRCRIHK